MPDLAGKFARLDDPIARPWQGCKHGSTRIPHSAGPLGPHLDLKSFLLQQGNFALSSDTPFSYANCLKSMTLLEPHDSELRHFSFLISHFYTIDRFLTPTPEVLANAMW